MSEEIKEWPCEHINKIGGDTWTFCKCRTESISTLVACPWCGAKRPTPKKVRLREMLLSTLMGIKGSVDIDYVCQQTAQAAIKWFRKQRPDKESKSGVDPNIDNWTKGWNDCLDEINRILNEEEK